jgi:hypothetical protein
MASNYVRSEVEFALDKKVKLIPVYLDGMDVLPPGLALMLHSTQGIEGKDSQIIIFKIRQWLVQNWGGGDGQHSSVPAGPKLLKKKKAESKEEENFWGFGHHGNKEEYERYLQIKNSLGDKTDQSYRRSSYKNSIPKFSFPFLKWPVRLIFVTCVTEVIMAYLGKGFQTSFVTETLVYWGLPVVVSYWYFTQRYSGQYSLFDLLPFAHVIQGTVYCFFLLGWLLMAFEPNSFKIWVVWIAQVISWLPVRFALDYKIVQTAVWPSIPASIKSAGFWSVLISGAFLLIDMVGALLRSKF